MFAYVQRHVSARNAGAKRQFTFGLPTAHTRFNATRNALPIRKLVLIVALLAVFAAPVAQARGRSVDRGLVVRVDHRKLELRELDGSMRIFVVSQRTVIILDGRSAALAQLRTGDIAFVTHTARRAAVLVRAFTQ